MTFPDPAVGGGAPQIRSAFPGAYGTPPGYFQPVPGPPVALPVARGGAPLADATDRFLSHLIDLAIMTALNLIPTICAFAIVADRALDALRQMNDAESTAINTGQAPDPWPYLSQLIKLELVAFAIILPISLAIGYLYLVTYNARRGQTIGKRVMKLKIVSASDGTPATKRALRKRWLVAQPAGLVGLYFMYADSLWLLWDKPYRQCLHDKCADTVVVKVTA